MVRGEAGESASEKNRNKNSAAKGLGCGQRQRGAGGVIGGMIEKLFKAGMVEGRVIDIAGIQELSSMPSKEALWSKILWLINAPAQRLVTVINGVGRDLAIVIDQGVKEEKFTA